HPPSGVQGRHRVVTCSDDAPCRAPGEWANAPIGLEATRRPGSMTEKRAAEGRMTSQRQTRDFAPKAGTLSRDSGPARFNSTTRYGLEARSILAIQRKHGGR